MYSRHVHACSAFCARAAVACAAAFCAIAAEGAPERLDVVAVYYPHWHRYPKGDEWFHPGWTEWEYVRDAKRLYPGHKQPMVPYAGYLDGSNPADVSKEIALASNAGIDVFLYDYYWYDGKVTQEEALEKGFLCAPNRDRMKFAIMWCYHERNYQWRPALGSERRRLMSLAHTKDEFLGLIDHCIANYFARPEYWRKDGKVFFSIFNAWHFYTRHGANAAAVRAELDEARARIRAAGLGEAHFNAQNISPRNSAAIKAAGFDSITDYNLATGSVPRARRLDGQLLFDYASNMPDIVARRCAEMDSAALPYMPNVTTGWDATPRCRQDEPYPWAKREYPYGASFTNNTADAFRKSLEVAKAWAESSPKKPGAVYVNGWNEYTEGTYLVPNNWDSDGFLRAVAAVFGRRPAGEYTFVDPVTKGLFTIPSATFEDVAYGGHPRQKLDVWLPKSGGGPFPVVVYFHGGGWDGGAIVDRIAGNAVSRLTERGVAVVSSGYRYIRDARADGVKPPVAACIGDCEAALRFVKAHAEDWKLDCSRLGLVGGSAGGCTALCLALRDGNAHSVKAVAPIIPQTSMDPAEMREWIPGIRYGGHAFGYGSFDEWLLHREACLDDIGKISPAALLRRIDAARAPAIYMLYPKRLAGRSPDLVHSPAFGERFAEIARKRGIPCEVAYGGREFYGAAFDWIADELCRR